MHGEKKEDDKTMEVEANDVWVKRKERIPLEEISVDDENGKKQKMEGEVMAWGKSWYNTLDRHWLRGSHVESNECCMLELLGAWKPLYSESSPKACFGGRSHLCFSYGNQGCSI